MAYGTYDQIKLITKLPGRVTENDVVEFIAMADRQLQRDIATEIVDEIPYGSINGDNVNYFLNNRYIADTDYDETVDGTDIVVYYWSDAADASTKSIVPTDDYTIDADDGLVIFDTAPTTDDGVKITVDYSFYNSRPDFTLIVQAACVLAAGFYAGYEYDMMPEDYMLGPVRVRVRSRGGTTPYERFMRRYDQLIARILGIEHVAGYPEDIPESGITRADRVARKEGQR